MPVTQDASRYLNRLDAERVEQTRQAALRSLRLAKEGHTIDPKHLEWAREFVATTPELRGVAL
jgi:hypothetical protein